MVDVIIVFKVEMQDAESCSDLVAYALCDSYEKHCRCPVGMIQYAGAVCQVRLTGEQRLVITFMITLHQSFSMVTS